MPYAGEFVNFDRISSWPKPVQRPYSPDPGRRCGLTVLDRVLAFGAAWFPKLPPWEGLAERVAELRSRAARPIDVEIMAYRASPLSSDSR